MSRAIERGIRQDAYGYRVFVRVNGTLRSKRFPPDTDLVDLRRWRDERTARRTYQIADPAAEGRSLADDCRRYLTAVSGMPTYRDRKYRIELWRKALGPGRDRADITAAQIRTVLETWRRAGKSAGTLNLRRTALMHLYTVLDGKSARNPVRDVPPYRETPPALRLPTLRQVEKVIRQMPMSATRCRVQVLLWTGWPPAQLMRLTPADISWSKREARLPARQKGRGAPARRLPLLPKAVTALKRLQRLDGFGPFSTHSLRHSLHTACDKADVPRFRPYDLRHLFLTRVALAVKDDRVVAEFAQHADVRMTRRYTEQSVSPRLKEALNRLSGAKGGA